MISPIEFYRRFVCRLKIAFQYHKQGSPNNRKLYGCHYTFWLRGYQCSSDGIDACSLIKLMELGPKHLCNKYYNIPQNEHQKYARNYLIHMMDGDKANNFTQLMFHSMYACTYRGI